MLYKKQLFGLLRLGKFQVNKTLMTSFYRAFIECVLTSLNCFYGLALSILNKKVKLIVK